MPCYHPLTAYRTSSGQVVFSSDPRKVVAELKLPCGQCVGCRLERSRQWAVRCMHEASMHAHNCFITLTYNDENVPISLRYKDFQDFMKRLRQWAKRRGFPKVRFYMCGEYGEQNDRAHFHACLFGFDFPDKQPLRQLGVSTLFRSAVLDSLWPYGYSSIGEVTFESAAYVARYIMKKITGGMVPSSDDVTKLVHSVDPADKHYLTVIEETGEIVYRVPEFSHMSLKPGIGAGWLDKYYSDVYPSDEVIVRGKSCKPPKYYDRRYAEFIDGIAFEDIVYSRELEARLHPEEDSDDRRAVKEHVTHARIRSFKRNNF